MAKSLIDYIFRFLGARFLSADQRRDVGHDGDGRAARASAACRGATVEARRRRAAARASAISFSPQADAPSCSDCGAIMIRNGSCYKCLNCGATSGCS